MTFSLEALAQAAGVRKSSRCPTLSQLLRSVTPCAAFICCVNAWSTGARNRLMATYNPSITDDLPEYERAEAALANEISVLVSNITLTGGALAVWADGVEEWHRNRVIAGALSAANVDVSTRLSPFDVRATVGEATAWNTLLIRNVSEDMRQRINNIFFAGFRAGTPPVSLGGKLQSDGYRAEAR